MNIQISSDYYGNYEMELVAIFDVRSFPSEAKRNLQMNELRDSNMPQAMKANSEFRKFCSCFNLVSLPHAKDKDGDLTFAIFAPLDDMNDNWLAKNMDCDYVKAVKSNGSKPPKKLPVSTKRAKWDKFLEKYPMMKSPREFQSMEEINSYYSNLYQ